jgi:imidazolonepropionase-like amidohydrolase
MRLQLAVALATVSSAFAQVTVLKPARVFDGESMHENWSVRVNGNRIEAAGATVDTAGATIIDLPATTLLPGLVEGHSHIIFVRRSWPDSPPFATWARKARNMPTSN